jgi:hypothetical protein
MKYIDKLENKFIVINEKRFQELSDKNLNSVVQDFLNSLERFKSIYEFYIGKKLDQKYIVCNQDEPYSEQIAKIILENEDEEKIFYNKEENK